MLLSISNDFVSTKICGKLYDFNFKIVNFPFLDGDDSYGVYISQLNRFARALSHVADFNTGNKLLAKKLLKQGYRYHTLRNTFSIFYRRYYDLISKFQSKKEAKLDFLLDNIFIRFGTKLYRQVVGIPMGTNCAPLVADLFLFCYERDFMMSLSDDKQADVIDAFNTTSRYLDNILNINNVYFENMVSQIYPSELQLNKANASDTEAAFLDLHLSISNGIVSTKIYDKRDDFDFEIVNFPFLDGDVPRSTSYGVYISQLNAFVFLEHLAMLLTSTPAINC